MGQVIVITSGKGGVGKTTTTANLAMGLALEHKTVLAIDIDTGLRNLDVIMGQENRIVYNLVDVLEGNCRLKQAIIKDKNIPGLSLLPTAQTRDKSSVTPQKILKLMESLKNSYDYILLDSPAGIEKGFQAAIAAADAAIVVTTPDVSAIRDADRVIQLLETNKVKDTKLILNRIRPKLVRQGDMMSPEDVTEILGRPILGILPDDEAVLIATNQGQALILGDSLAAQGYKNMVRRILGEEVPYMDLEPRRSVFSRIFHRD